MARHTFILLKESREKLVTILVHFLFAVFSTVLEAECVFEVHAGLGLALAWDVVTLYFSLQTGFKVLARFLAVD